MALQEMLDREQLARFFDGAYGFAPSAWPHAARSVVGHATWETLDGILESSAADVVVSHEGKPRPFTEPLTPDAARRMLGEGSTLTVRRADRHSQPLARLAAAFETDFGSPVDIHLTATPAGSSGFGW